jgi:hypothetical protein
MRFTHLKPKHFKICYQKPDIYHALSLTLPLVLFESRTNHQALSRGP